MWKTTLYVPCCYRSALGFCTWPSLETGCSSEQAFILPLNHHFYVLVLHIQFGKCPVIQISSGRHHISESTWWLQLSVREHWFWTVYRNLSPLCRLNTLGFFFCFPAYIETRCEVTFPYWSSTIEEIVGPPLSLSPVSLFWHIRNH